MKLVSYNPQHTQIWDDFLLDCPMATFLHSRKFLAYHGDKFKDRSLLFYDDKEKLVGIFPAAESLSNPQIIISHPGITYGGILHQDKLLGVHMVDAMKELINYYKEHGYHELIYKAVPYFHHKAPASDDLYALFALNAKLYRRDLSCTIDLFSSENQTNIQKRIKKVRSAIKKALNNNLVISNDRVYLEKLWVILTANLREKYNTSPAHSLAEIKLLLEKFPQNIQIITVLYQNKVVAGTILFLDRDVVHTQYLVVTEQGMNYCALDFLIQNCITEAQNKKFRYFDFGTNNEKEGAYLNHPLYFSKTKHGGSGTVYDFYKFSFNENS